MNMNKIIFLLIILFALGFAGCSPDAYPSPEQSLLAYVKDWNSGNYEGMYEILTDAAKSNHTEEMFANRHKYISDNLAITSLELKDIMLQESESNKVDVSYTLDFFTNTVSQFSHTYTASLEKGENCWLINWEQSHILPNLTPENTIKVTRQFPKRGSIIDRNQTPLANQGVIREIGVVTGKISDEKIGRAHV